MCILKAIYVTYNFYLTCLRLQKIWMGTHGFCSPGPFLPLTAPSAGLMLLLMPRVENYSL